MATDFEGVLAKVAQIGYKEVEPANGYNKKEAKSFRALLDRFGLSMPSTHTNYPEAGAELEQQLEAQQIMGIRYTRIRPPRPASAFPRARLRRWSPARTSIRARIKRTTRSRNWAPSGPISHR